MKYYYLFGSEAVNLWEEHGQNISQKFIDELVTYCMYDAYVHNSTDHPSELLNAYDGWGGFVEISQTDYDKIVKAAHKLIKSKP